MFKLEDKTILIFSPQSWGKMKVSKHHYAIELAKRGNRVYYINPPSDKATLKVTEVSDYPGIYVVESGLNYLRTIRFHSNYLFKLYNKYNLRRIAKAINRPIDVVWSFEFFGCCDFSFFKTQYKITFPVDFVKKEEIANAKGANILFSIAEEIIDEFSPLEVPSYFVNHSVSEHIIGDGKNSRLDSDQRKVGYVGNLHRYDINYELIFEVVKSNPQLQFIFIGNYERADKQIEPGNQSQKFIEKLWELENTSFTGVLDREQLAKKMKQINVFLIAYKRELDFCRGVNYHKAIEYLATGSVIVSNHITTYKGKGLIEMIDADDNEDELINVFSKVVNEIDYYNSTELREKRISFAKKNTYSANVDRIIEKINKEEHSLKSV